VWEDAPYLTTPTILCNAAVEEVSAGFAQGLVAGLVLQDKLRMTPPNWYPDLPRSGGMDLFEYVGVLVSVVVGLALAHILTGVSRTIQSLHQVRLYWVHCKAVGVRFPDPGLRARRL
jgi:hypothetical protein